MSTTDIAVLIVEDRRGTSNLFRDVLREPGVRDLTAGSYLEARAQIQSEEIHAAMVDLWLEDQGKPEPAGRHVCGLIRERHPECFIILYSQEFDDKPDGNWQELGLDAGADVVLGVSKLHEKGNKLRAFLRDGIAAKRDARRGKRSLVVATDLRTSAAVRTIGEDTLRDIIARLIPQGAMDNVTAISGGYSGSEVFRVISAAQQTGAAGTKNILKVDARRSQIEAELAGAPQVGAPEEFAAARPIKSLSSAVNGFWAFLAPAVDGKTLRDVILHDAMAQREFTRIVDAIREDIVRPGLTRAAVVQNDVPDWTRINANYAVQILDAVDIVHEAAMGLQFALFEKRCIVDFVEQAVRYEWSPSRTIPVRSFLHGDLHADNILVDKLQRVFVIDFARSYLLPRTFDVASLFIDLTMRAVTGPVSMWQLNEVAAWLEAVRDLRPFGVKKWREGFTKAKRVTAILGMLESELDDCDPPVSQGELRDVMIYQLLRHGRFPNTPMPLRIALFTLAEALIRKTEHVT
jgi:hypothetical protein